MISISIIGCGPRGLSILEKLSSVLKNHPANFQINIIDPGKPGEGSHPSNQPSHLVTNTVSSQVGIFDVASEFAKGAGESLTSWAIYSGYKKVDEIYCKTTNKTAVPITDVDHLPRSLLGEYLSWGYSKIVDSFPENVTIVEHRKVAVDIDQLSQSNLRIRFDDESNIETNYIFLTIGHGTRKNTSADYEFLNFANNQLNKNSNLAYFNSPYPVKKLDVIDKSSIVAIQGLGLTAYDVISQLTIGRGGKFQEKPDSKELIYIPSGLEPKLILQSRNCLPFSSRGINQKGIAGKHVAKFFTPDAVRGIIQRKGRCGKINFENNILTLIKKEMSYAFRLCSDINIDINKFEPTTDELEIIENTLYPLKGKTFNGFDDFRCYFISSVRNDLDEAEKGNLTSGIKAATDVLRDVREALRISVEFSQLEPESHESYINDFVSVTNRISFGPPKRRNYELLALFDAGLINLAGGPNSKIFCNRSDGSFEISSNFGDQSHISKADVLIISRIDPYSPITDSSTLSKNIYEKGIIREYKNEFYHPSGLEIDRNCRVIGKDGISQSNIWAIGYIVEGQHFYTHALPRPGMNSRFTDDAKNAISSLNEMISQKQQGNELVNLYEEA